MKKITALLIYSLFTAISMRADVLFQDSTNYPYTNGCIEGQGQWYCYYPANTTNFDAFVTNDVLYLNTSNYDEVATPTNGWVNSTEYNFASFTINVSQLPGTTNGGFFCQLQDNFDSNDCCHVFIDTRGTVVPGTYRLGIANFDSSFSTQVPPVNYPLDLATGITYTVVILFDTNQDNSTFVGSTLWINPSEQDYENVVDDDIISSGVGDGFVYGLDTTGATNLLNINISQIGFSHYANAGISNVIAGTTFDDVNTTNLPVFGVQPQSQTNYSGNSATFYTVASGVDLAYQWSSTTSGILHDDGVNIIGSSSNILTLNNLSASDNYYVVATDAYNNTATSATATNMVITTPTAPFFPPSQPGQSSTGGLNLTNNLFTSFGLTNVANGTGPLTYQWYFAPTNTPTTFTQLTGQTASTLIISELEYPNAGNYYVSATGPDGVTAGPTNSLAVVPPLVATLPQLHEFMGLVVSNITGSSIIPINTNSVSVTGYVTTFGPLTATNKTFSEFYVGYQNSGIYVFYGSAGTNTVPPPGSYVTVTGPCQVYHGQLEIDPGVTNGVVISNTVPVQMPAPQLGNFAQLSTNALGAYGVQAQCSLVTFTNIYIYGSKTGSVYTANGGKYFSNSSTTLYMTQGQYNKPNNTNYIQLFVAAYGNGSISTNFWGDIVPNHAYQITGVMANFNGASELDPTRIDDIVSNTPPSFPANVTQANGVPTISWPAQSGSTYSVNSATNLTGPWTNQAFGLSYYPSTGTYTDTNPAAAAQFYRISTP
jgi:hypothetical protein